MSPQERLNSFNFPQGVDSDLLEKLGERARKTRSLRTAIAHQIEEEGLLFRELTQKFFPQDAVVKAAVDEYTMMGTIILETESARQSGYNNHRVELLKKDPKGFFLLTWWVNLRLEELKHSPAGKEEREAAIIGMTNGNKRFRKLYQALSPNKY